MDYGYDMDLFLDLTRDMRATTGKRLVINDLIGRLVDSLFYDPSFGIQLQNRLKRVNVKTLPNLETEVVNELERDDRVESVQCSIVYDPSTNNVNVSIAGVLRDGDTFEFIGSMDDEDLVWSFG